MYPFRDKGDQTRLRIQALTSWGAAPTGVCDLLLPRFPLAQSN